MNSNTVLHEGKSGLVCIEKSCKNTVSPEGVVFLTPKLGSKCQLFCHLSNTFSQKRLPMRAVKIIISVEFIVSKANIFWSLMST